MRTENTFLHNLIYVKLKWTICIFEESMSYLTTYKIVQIPEMFNCSIVLQLASYLFHEALHDHFSPDLILWLVTPCYHDCCPPLHASTICYLVYFCVYIPTFFFSISSWGGNRCFICSHCVSSTLHHQQFPYCMYTIDSAVHVTGPWTWLLVKEVRASEVVMYTRTWFR